jgi:long-chain fatty acid transport protein
VSTRHAAAIAAVVLLLGSSRARASNPLEYPDNGSAAFSRGGAWLATGNEPIAAHYNPATLVTQNSGFSVETQLAFTRTCFDRRGPGDAPVGPDDASSGAFYRYDVACTERSGFPTTVPSIAVALRATDSVAFGFAVVPPATYGTAQGQFPLVAPGTGRAEDGSRAPASLPAPYRYLQVEQRSTILFPTASIGVALSRHLRVGAGFVAGIGVINLSTVGVSRLGANDAAGDHMEDDSLSTLRTRDLFVPGATASIHWSLAPTIDVAAWGRWMDAIRTSSGSLDVTQRVFGASGEANPPCSGLLPDGTTSFSSCGNQSVPNHFPDAVQRFVYKIPPEVRAGLRFHMPRSDAARAFDEARVRDPLHDDVFDVEINGSFAWNSRAHAIEVRFPEVDGRGVLNTLPTNVPVPPNADRPTGYRDSFGVRLGGQWNAVRDVFGFRAGGWFESNSQDPRFLTVAPVGATRFGFGGGIVARYGAMDVSIGYQRHLSLGLDNHGDGGLRAPAGTADPPFNLAQEPPGVSAEDRTQFRTRHAVNGGSVNFDAHVFTLGGTVRF